MFKSYRLLIAALAGMAILWIAAGRARQNTAKLVEGPYLQSVTQTSAAILWQTSAPTASLLEYGNPPVQISDPTKTTLHEMTISGLSTGTDYPYQVSIDGSGQTWTDPYTIQTAPAADQPFRMVVYGDSRSDPAEHGKVIQDIIAAHPALVLHTGDLVTTGLLPSTWDDEFFTPADPLLHTVPIYPVMGNHDVPDSWFLALFALPGNEQWYAFTYGSARIIALNTNVVYGPDSDQGRWLASEFQSADYRAARWHIVFFHVPPFGSSGHNGDAAVASTLVPLFEQNKVDLVFSGHNHDYERSAKDGIPYITTGGGGAPLYDFVAAPLDANPYSLVRDKAFHYCTLDISPDQVVFAAWDVDGKQIDSLTLPARK